MAVACQLPVPGSDETCGIDALGRCVRCQLAFCRSHRGYAGHHYYAGGQFHENVCSACIAAQEKRWADEQKWEDAQRARIPELARELAKSGLQPTGRTERVYVKSGLFGRNRDYDSPIDPAWPIGVMRWRQRETSGQAEQEDYETGVTAEGVVVTMRKATWAHPVVSKDSPPSQEREWWVEVAKRLEHLLERT